MAVLAIFDEIGVNKSLYFLVFGESLFNDGVTVVLYNTMVTLSHAGDHVDYLQYFMAFLSFFFVVLGGLFIGFCVGAFSAFFCKFTSHTRGWSKTHFGKLIIVLWSSMKIFFNILFKNRFAECCAAALLIF